MKLRNMMIAMASGLALLMAVPAMAEDSVVLDFDFSGFTCTMPGRFDEMTGMLVPEDKGPLYAENLEDLCGTMKYRPRTLEEVGQVFNVTRERIRQIEAKALKKLKNPVRGRMIQDYLKN